MRFIRGIVTGVVVVCLFSACTHSQQTSGKRAADLKSPATSVGPDVLISMSSQESGHELVDISFDEISHKAGVSVTATRLRSGTSTGKAFYIGSCYSILCRLRGYSYFALIDSWSEDGVYYDRMVFSNSNVVDIPAKYKGLVNEHRRNAPEYGGKPPAPEWTSAEAFRVIEEQFGFDKYEEKLRRKYGLIGDGRKP